MSATIIKSNDEKIDELEAEIVMNHAPLDIPVKHLFAKGMYIREVAIPAGSLVTSKIHKREHPFTISKGIVKVSDQSGEWVTLTAPYTGITAKGTRRVVFVVEDCVWTTYHVYSSITGKENDFNEQEIEKITDRVENRIILKRENKVLNKAKKEKICLT